MASVLPGSDCEMVEQIASILPRPQQLASLGTVLCLYRPQHGSELSGWAQAVRVESRAGVDSEGLRESLMFFDCNGDCCWRLCLLPDSDFLAWDRLLGSLPACAMAESESSVAERLWRRLAGRLLGGQWQACALRFHEVPAATSPHALAASLAAISALGSARARRIAQAEGAEELIRHHDCCCAQSSFAASNAAPSGVAQASPEFPLIRFEPRK